MVEMERNPKNHWDYPEAIFGDSGQESSKYFPTPSGWSGDMYPPYRLGLVEERDPSYHDMNQLYMSESGGKKFILYTV